jgi:hypothetical protein
VQFLYLNMSEGGHDHVSAVLQPITNEGRPGAPEHKVDTLYLQDSKHDVLQSTAKKDLDGIDGLRGSSGYHEAGIDASADVLGKVPKLGQVKENIPEVRRFPLLGAGVDMVCDSGSQECRGCNRCISHAYHS